MKNILIIGGLGFIGINFIKYLQDNYSNEYQIFNIDICNYAGTYKLSEKKLYTNGYLNRCFNSFRLDISEIMDCEIIDQLIKDKHIDIIVNFAAQTHVDNSLSNPVDFWKTNIQGAINIGNIALNNKIRLHHISTDEVYGSVTYEDKVDENFYINPSSPYSASKASADLCLLSMAKCFGLQLTISRCANNYGKFQHPEKLIPKVINCVKNKELIPIYGNGLQVRNWIHVFDHASAIMTIIENGIIGEVYNVAGPEYLTNIDLIKIITNNDESLFNHVTDRIMHDVLYRVNDDKLRTTLNWIPKYNIKDFILNEKQ